MFEFKLPEYKCTRCGAKVSSPGECISCSMRSDYQKGLEDGRKKAQRENDPMYYMRCSECGQYPGHSFSCSQNPAKIDLRSDYDKGFDSGYKSSKSNSSSGDNEFQCLAD